MGDQKPAIVGAKVQNRQRRSVLDCVGTFSAGRAATVQRYLFKSRSAANLAWPGWGGPEKRVFQGLSKRACAPMPRPPSWLGGQKAKKGRAALWRFLGDRWRHIRSWDA